MGVGVWGCRYTRYATTALGSTHQVVHAPGNNGNTNWGNHCVGGWLGPEASRWDIITTNFGLHDLAFPDNEHIDVTLYSTLLHDIFSQLDKAIKSSAKLFWVTTTPVPTHPSPDCVLIPGRIEPDVLKYNAAAAQVVQEWNSRSGRKIVTCDLHAVINNHWYVTRDRLLHKAHVISASSLHTHRRNF